MAMSVGGARASELTFCTGEGNPIWGLGKNHILHNMSLARVTFRVTVRGAGSADAAAAAGGSAAAAPRDATIAFILGGDADELGRFDPERALPLVRMDSLDGTPQTPGAEVWATANPVALRPHHALHYT